MTSFAKHPDLFDHKKAVRELAKKYDLDEKKVEKIVNNFFGKWGMKYFIRRFQQVTVVGRFKIMCTRRSAYFRHRLKFQRLLMRLRYIDRNRWGRPDNY